MTARVSYGNVVFRRPSQVSISATPVQDDDQPTIRYTRYDIQVDAIVEAGLDTTLDAAMAALRSELTRPGNVLIVEDTGFGPIYVTGSGLQGAGQNGAVQDVMGGPFPELLSFQPLGGSRSAQISWRVVAAFNDCPHARTRDILSYSYTVSTSIDSNGLTTRSISGSVVIVPERIGRSIKSTAEKYRHLIPVKVPLGFRRESQSFRLSPDRTTLSFDIRDKEIDSPNALPEGVSDIDATHALSWNRSHSASATGTISATITLTPGQPLTRAYEAFKEIVKERLTAARLSSKGVLLESLNVAENLFSHSANFSVRYRVYHTLKDLLEEMGFFQPLGTKWDAWAKSMVVPWSPHGVSALVAIDDADTIVDQCGGWPQTRRERSIKPSMLYYRIAAIKNGLPDPANSYLNYYLSSEIQEDSEAARQKPAGAQPPQGGDQGNSDAKQKAMQNYGTASGTNDIIQIAARPSYSARLIGWAVRGAYPIAKPKLQKIGDRDAIEVAARFRQEVVGKYFGLPVYRAAWDIRYMLDNAPGTTPPIYTPIEPPESKLS